MYSVGISLMPVEEYTSSQLRCIGLTAMIRPKWDNSIDCETIEIEVTTGNLTPIEPNRGCFELWFQGESDNHRHLHVNGTNDE